MIKVEHTKLHLANDLDSMHRIVADAELVLVKCNKHDASLRKVHGEGQYWLLLNPNGWLNDDEFFKPILVSRTEKIEDGDWVYDEFVKNVPTNEGLISQATGEHFEEGKFHDGYHFKILALPEHFSPSQLQDIVDGKLKEGKCLVECEWTGGVYCAGVQTNSYQIKLNPHITLYPVEKKMYTIEDMFSYIGLWIQKDVVRTGIASQIAFEKWFEQNVK